MKKIQMNKNGITLMSLIIYITLMFVILALIMRVTTYFTKNLNDAADTKLETEFEKLNIYMLKETKRDRNIAEISNESKNITFTTDEEKHVYSFNAEDQRVYLNEFEYNKEEEEFIQNNTIVLCSNVQNCIFSKQLLTNNKIQINVSLTVDNNTQTMPYIMLNKSVIDNDILNEIDYSWDVDGGNPIIRSFLYVGDYLEYSPPDKEDYIIEKEYSGCPEDITVGQENLTWRILNINNNSIDVISTTATQNGVDFQGALGYNNAVYLMNDCCNWLYGDQQKNITARSIKVEDIEEKMDIVNGWDYKNSDGYGSEYQTGAGNTFYPVQWENENKTYGKSESFSLVTQKFKDVGAEYKITLNYWSNLYRNITFLSAKTRNNDKDNEIYKELLDINNKHLFATRMTMKSTSVGGQFGLMKKHIVNNVNMIGSGSFCYANGTENLKNIVEKIGMLPIVTIPLKSLDITSGDGSIEKPWNVK